MTVFIWADDRLLIEDYLASVANLDYQKSAIHLFIALNKVDDFCNRSLTHFLNRHGPAYNNITVKSLSSDIRLSSIRYALANSTHYFTMDQNVILHPHALTRLHRLNLEVVAPMLISGGMYSNFHAYIDANGYYRGGDNYHRILTREQKGIFGVPVVNGCYLIRHRYLRSIAYNDGSGRAEYVVACDSLRKNGVPQYIDNTFNYGILVNYEGKSAKTIHDMDMLNNKRFFLGLSWISQVSSNNEFRKGVICDIEWLASYLIYEHYHLIRLLHDEFGFDVINSKRLDFTSPDIISDLNSYDSILVAYQGAVNIPMDSINCHKVLRIDDLVSYNQDYDKLLSFFTANSDIVISPYAYVLNQYFKHDKVEWVPYSSAIEGCENVHELDFNDHPVCKVFLSGSVAWDRPFRQYVMALDDEHLEKLPHPGYGGKFDDTSPAIVRTKYYGEIRRYLCCFTDAHSYRYIHLKNFEIASVGSLLLTDKLIETEMKELGFVDNETCIFCDRDSFLEKVYWIADPANRAEVDRIRRAGMKLVREKHLSRHRASQINELVRKSLGTSS